MIACLCCSGCSQFEWSGKLRSRLRPQSSPFAADVPALLLTHGVTGVALERMDWLLMSTLLSIPTEDAMQLAVHVEAIKQHQRRATLGPQQVDFWTFRCARTRAPRDGCDVGYILGAVDSCCMRVPRLCLFHEHCCSSTPQASLCAKCCPLASREQHKDDIDRFIIYSWTLPRVLTLFIAPVLVFSDFMGITYNQL